MHAYLFRFDDEAEAAAALPSCRADGAWTGDVLLQRMMRPAEWDASDPDNIVQTAAAAEASGVYLTISRKHESPELRAATGCMAVMVDNVLVWRSSEFASPPGYIVTPVLDGANFNVAA